LPKHKLPTREEFKEIDKQIEATMSLSLKERKEIGLIHDAVEKEMNAHQVASSITEVYKRQDAENKKWLRRIGQHTIERQQAIKRRREERDY
jgi:hypothetical protein